MEQPAGSRPICKSSDFRSEKCALLPKITTTRCGSITPRIAAGAAGDDRVLFRDLIPAGPLAHDQGVWHKSSLLCSEVRERIARRLLLAESPGFELSLSDDRFQSGQGELGQVCPKAWTDRGVVALP